MLNMQQTILNQIPGTEQPQEEVQLTELLPVKQSRIRENSIFKDADATDALKVLRSFTGGCNEEQEFELQAFEFCGKVDRPFKQGGKQQRASNQRKRIGKCKRTHDDSINEGKERTNDQRGDNKTITKKIQSIAKRNVGRARSLKRKVIKTIKRSEVDFKDSGCSGGEDTSEKHAFGEDDEVLSEYDEEEESAYLDLDKGKDFNDEIYVYRREALDPCSTPDPKRRRNTNSENANNYDTDYSTTDGTLFSHTALSQSKDGTPKSIKDKENGKNSKSQSNQKIRAKNCEKELTLNINAIIEANYLLERENNNVVQPNQNKLEDSSSTSPSSLSSLAEGAGSSSNDEGTPRKSIEKINDPDDQQEDNYRNAQQKDENPQDQQQQKKYCCVVCDARFKGSGGLRNHYKIVHGAGPIFKCDECGKEFPLKERLKLHVRTHTGFKPYKCPECDKSFARGGQLVQHRRTHSQVKPYRCALCSGTFTCAANLALHVKRHNGQKDHKCEICGRAFVRRDALKKHLECLHRDVKSFLCVICNKTFKGHLPQHMRTHARDRPHGCATCGQRFAQKSQLTVHQRTHSGQRPFRCLVCWQAFAHSTALKLHTRRHTGERPFKCAECNAGFTQLPHWKKHMKCIHGRNEPYGCKRCKSFFRIKNDLESHEKTCHPEAGENAEGISSSCKDVTANEATEKAGSPPSKYRVMTVERMRLLLAVLLKRISRQERLDELGFGKRLIDEVLQDSLISAGKDPATGEGLTELETLTKNLEIFLEWTVPKEHWEHFRKLKKTPEDILETLTAT